MPQQESTMSLSNKNNSQGNNLANLIKFDRLVVCSLPNWHSRPILIIKAYAGAIHEEPCREVKHAGLVVQILVVRIPAELLNCKV